MSWEDLVEDGIVTLSNIDNHLFWTWRIFRHIEARSKPREFIFQKRKGEDRTLLVAQCFSYVMNIKREKEIQYRANPSLQ